MRTNYTAETIPYELDKDRSRAYMAPSALREAHMKPGQHVKITFDAQETVLKIVPKFDGDENAVYLSREELAHLAARPGDLLCVKRLAEEYPEAEEVTVHFKSVRKTVERLESLRLMLTDKSIVSQGETVLGGIVRIKKEEKAKITDNTKIKIETEDRAVHAIGLDNEIEEIKRFIDGAHSAHWNYTEQKDWSIPHGLIITGETGMGKKTLCLFVLQEIGKEWIRVHGNSIKSVEDAFEYAKLNEPCTIWIDRLDRYLEEKQTETVICLEKVLDEIKRDKRRIAIIATVSSLDQVPKEIKCAHVLDRLVALHAPSLAQREAQILGGLSEHKVRTECQAEISSIQDIAKRTAGFTRGEIYLLLRDSLARLHDALYAIQNLPLSESIKNLSITTRESKKCDGLCIRQIITRIVRVIPSASDGAPAEVPDIRFSSIFGQDEAKEKLKEAVIWPVVHSKLFEEMGVRPPKGVLLYGPPGCGKTLIAQALANESGAVFLSIRGPEIMGKYVGESEERVRKVFARARSQTPSIIFIDEIDSIAPHRETEGGQVDKRVVSTLLTEMDGVGSAPGVFVLGATNKPWSIDSALMRPGRFDCHVLVDLPKKETRREIICNRMAKTLQAIHKWQKTEDTKETDVSMYDYFAEETKGFTGAEIAGMCTEMAMEALRFRIECNQERKKNQNKIKKEIFSRLKKIVERTNPRIPVKEIEAFKMFTENREKASQQQEKE